MNYRQHMIIGGISFFPASLLLSPIIFFALDSLLTYKYIAFILLGSLAPDIDHPKAYAVRKGRNSFFLTGIILILINTFLFSLPGSIADAGRMILIVGILILVVPIILYYGFGHRTITHSLVALFVFLIISAALFFVSNEFFILGLGFSLGYGLHLYADGKQKHTRGVPLFYPFKKTYYHTRPVDGDRLLKKMLLNCASLILYVFTLYSVYAFFAYRNLFAELSYVVDNAVDFLGNILQRVHL